ncbi:uncharacterized protein LOC118756495 [Rhagoletis pomonella]|uniref:uncharacterized protein LOC118756495 n=1 Tax=Rhagoletis pomonella TaxID=28610 RepID=UPI00177D161E|nr:uncharacterized protein LOC118756495 [Rhagoletis pomonella]
MESLSGAIEEQRRTQTHLTRIQTNFESKQSSEISRGYVQSLLAEIDTIFQDFKRGHEQIYTLIRNASLDEDDIPYLKEEVFYTCYDLYIAFKSTLLDRQNDLAPWPSPLAHASTFAMATTRNDTTAASARLPKIDLPKFSGDYLEWIPFRDMFLSLVHNNDALTPVQKYFYLKGSCIGTPKEMVEEFPATDASYETAWAALVSRFHNKRKLVDQILKRLVNAQNTDGGLQSVKLLLDLTRNSLALLKTLEIDTSSWDPMLIFLLTQKLDRQIRKEWEQSLNGRSEIPPVQTFLKFLETTYRALEFIEEEDTSKKVVNRSYSDKQKQHKPARRQLHANAATTTASSASSNYSCPCCQKQHLLYKCFKFSALPAAEKQSFVLQHRLCLNCLGKGHTYSECERNSRCQACKQPHHTVIHNAFALRNNKNDEHKLSANLTTTAQIMNAEVHSATTNAQVLLATVRVIIETPERQFHLKALVDQGAQASFITEDAAQLLNLPKRNTNVIVAGIGGANALIAKRSLTLCLRSQYEKDFKMDCTAFILPKLTSYKPSPYHLRGMPNLSGIFLADPTFALPVNIDLVLGGDVYGDILLSGMKKYERGIFLQETHFGWMISGPSTTTPSQQILHTNLCTLDDQLRLFWEQEELHEERQLSSEETACENHFLQTYKRDKCGRYTVHLPFKTLFAQGKLPAFSGTDFNAVKRLKQLEMRFKNQPNFAKLYKDFMAEYLSLGHMQEVGFYPEDLQENSYFFCHHGVLRQCSSTTKLRVVFDGGNRCPPQPSLNDELAAGPALQSDLSSIISRWRSHKIAFTADLEKMFRQINVCKEHQNYQYILWREDSTKRIKIYKLCTVTYGTTSAPYLAIRVLRQLATDEQTNYPLASQVYLNDTYVDDIISGADTNAEAIELQQQLSRLSSSGGFNLRKWNSNSAVLLQTIPPDNKENANWIELKAENLVKALGLFWDTNEDEFSFKINFSFASAITKRSMLSDAAKLFDPLGWLAPTTIIAKIMFQRLWMEGLDWNDPLPTKLNAEWLQYRDSLHELESIKIPRWFGCNKFNKIELHGFSDASQAAYGAVVYAVVYNNSTISASLIQSKTKVTPLKTVSIPRLELCAAALLGKLMAKVKTYFHADAPVFYWTDSTVVLSWIRCHSTRWSVYIANRVAEIQRISDVSQWRHVRTSENPADCLTRGLTPKELKAHTLWWLGPTWLTGPISNWPHENLTFETCLEERKSYIASHVTTLAENSMEDPDFICKFSSLSRLVRVTAYILRFYYNLRAALQQHKIENNLCETGFLKSREIKHALAIIIKQVQRIDFTQEIHCLENKQALNKKSKILQLAPFLDGDNLLRVGGRISKAKITFDVKHPVLLSKQSFLSFLIFTDAHHQTLHGGVQQMLSFVSQRYWILSARSLAKSVLRKCVICFKYTAKVHQQQMGNLPAVRLQPTKPFQHSGLDYAGPITLKLSLLRKAATTKGYICLFICMCTKAIHLEVVSSLNTDAFIAAFRRFISRRGRCSDLYSDCGTTFVGANKELKISFQQQKASLPEHLAAALANEGTTWHFIPPASPNFGGLWEAAVKSTKHHLRRIMRDRVLTFEELSTLLAQIESCLNSRPLCPLSAYPTDHQALTPAHFLVGEPTTCVSEESLLDSNIDHLTRWKLVERLKQHFWHRWANEYFTLYKLAPSGHKFKKIFASTTSFCCNMSVALLAIGRWRECMRYIPVQMV